MSEEKTEADRAEETCMCGDPIEGHSTLAGHTPVSMADYYGFADMEESYRIEARQLREALYRAEEKQAEIAHKARQSALEEAEELAAASRNHVDAANRIRELRNGGQADE